MKLHILSIIILSLPISKEILLFNILSLINMCSLQTLEKRNNKFSDPEQAASTTGATVNHA